ncbi:hypothetical protein [Pseudoxanthomonas sp. z9]|uniref:hypothetical protein n=1 Tax=Pseudoxanthomonas sp. z9 TaxID=2584942 RepID=UPI001141944B|nr:hypothetical protein [Pseudoxanthomonas sp. z9]
MFFLAAQALPGPAHAARVSVPPQEVKLDALTRDTQKHSLGGGRMEMVWWIPPEYWQISVAQNKGTDPETTADLGRMFGDYNIVAVVQGTVASDMEYRFTPESDVRDSTVLIAPDGRVLSVVAEDKVPARLAATLAFLRPILANSIGPLGKSMYFLVFPGNDAAGKRLADPLGDGHLRVKTSSKTHDFRLPLGSLLPDKRDAASGESFPGDFLYNPYTGRQLDASQP